MGLTKRLLEDIEQADYADSEEESEATEEEDNPFVTHADQFERF